MTIAERLRGARSQAEFDAILREQAEKGLPAVREQFTYRSSAGEFEVDDDSLAVHLAAEARLAQEGKKPGQYTSAEYAEAVIAVGVERDQERRVRAQAETRVKPELDSAEIDRRARAYLAERGLSVDHHNYAAALLEVTS